MFRRIASGVGNLINKGKNWISSRFGGESGNQKASSKRDDT